MLINLHRKVIAASLALLLGFAAMAQAADARAAQDLGTGVTGQNVDVTLVLKVHHPEALEAFVHRTVTRSDPEFGKFLTTRQFA